MDAACRLRRSFDTPFGTFRKKIPALLHYNSSLRTDRKTRVEKRSSDGASQNSKVCFGCRTNRVSRQPARTKTETRQHTAKGGGRGGGRVCAKRASPDSPVRGLPPLTCSLTWVGRLGERNVGGNGGVAAYYEAGMGGPRRDPMETRNSISLNTTHAVLISYPCFLFLVFVYPQAEWVVKNEA